ncbi:tyrosine-type recombinase/integrase [Amycolatopsis taiwanensis]|uniref:tyrosine-type recombinase/integrase n=1 Tax=Amycolatopsis taiwanensis TaxID=342230 RepID=UPI00316AEC11
MADHMRTETRILRRRTSWCGTRYGRTARQRPRSLAGRSLCPNGASRHSRLTEQSRRLRDGLPGTGGKKPALCSRRRSGPNWTRPTSGACSGRSSRKQDWTPRKLRHSFVSLLSDNGMPIEQISRLMGHNGTTVTEKVYRHQLRPIVEHSAEAMDQKTTKRLSVPVRVPGPVSLAWGTGPDLGWAQEDLNLRPLRYQAKIATP